MEATTNLSTIQACTLDRGMPRTQMRRPRATTKVLSETALASIEPVRPNKLIGVIAVKDQVEASEMLRRTQAPALMRVW